MIEVVGQLDAYNSVTSELMSTQLRNILSMQSIIAHVDDSDNFLSISVINGKCQDSITPEELSSRLFIGLKKAICTLKATTHQYIRNAGLLTKRSCTNKYHLRYKQLSLQYSTFYTDFLRVQVTSICGYFGGFLYPNNIGFKKFFPCEIEKSKETGMPLRSFV